MKELCARGTLCLHNLVLSQRAVIYTDPVNAISFTSDQTRIISGSFGGIARVWNASFVSEEKHRRFRHSANVNGVSLSLD